ncbi:hypothetical protein AGMMS49579_15150 [Spirochaetia bacterium]|nr:hypothetical protein AGMMS49579_15150 [Spirochaetia bacterium]
MDVQEKDKDNDINQENSLKYVKHCYVKERKPIEKDVDDIDKKNRQRFKCYECPTKEKKDENIK